jgi:hypothetical protein
MLNLLNSISTILQVLVLAFVGYFGGKLIIDDWNRTHPKKEQPKVVEVKADETDRQN